MNCTVRQTELSEHFSHQMSLINSFAGNFTTLF